MRDVAQTRAVSIRDPPILVADLSILTLFGQEVTPYTQTYEVIGAFARYASGLPSALLETEEPCAGWANVRALRS